MFSFNGRTDGDAKKCWPLDVAVLEDGTPVITDFHNKKIKAFDATGRVMGEVIRSFFFYYYLEHAMTKEIIIICFLSNKRFA